MGLDVRGNLAGARKAGRGRRQGDNPKACAYDARVQGRALLMCL
jgi:hypothetical protein